MNKSYFFLLLLLLIPLTSALTLDSTASINTSISNSSMSFTTTIYANQTEVESELINITNVSYTNNDFSTRLIEAIWWAEENKNLDSSAYPKFESNNDTDATISNSLLYDVNGSLKFPISKSCNNLEAATYTPVSGGAYFMNITGSALSCTSGVISIDTLHYEINTSTLNVLVMDFSTPTIIEIISDQPCDIFDIRCIVVNEIVGSAILAAILFLILYLIVAWRLRMGFDQTVTFAIPFLLMIGIMFAGFSIMFAFITFIVGVMVAWVFNRVIKNA